MLSFALDASTISSLATGAGTLVLAIATFASVRSSNRSARVAEEALLEQRRPILTQSRFDDPVQKIMFAERLWVRAEGGRGVAEHRNGNVYLAMSLRNVGAGIGVCQAWAVGAGDISNAGRPEHLPEHEFRAQTRDLYVPAGDLGMWQGALREPDEPTHVGVAAAIDAGESVLVELLYSDQVGEQRTITRFALAPYVNQETDEVTWTVSTLRHWFLDRPGPRSESEMQARAEHIFARLEAGATAATGEEASAMAEQAEFETGPAEAAKAAPAAVPSNGSSAVDGERDGEGEGEPITVITRPSCE